MIKYIFFDMDGVIADTEPVHFISDVETFLDCGVDVEKEILTKFVSTFAGIAFGKVAKKVFEKFGNPKKFSSKKAFSKKDKFFEKNLKKINPKLSKGLPDFFTFLKEKGIKIGLISSSKKFEVDSILKHFKIENLFEFKITYESVKNLKPNPEPYLLALKKSGIEKNEVLIIEDSISGLKSGISAGIEVVILKTKYTKNQNNLDAIFVANDFFKIKNFVIKK